MYVSVHTELQANCGFGRVAIRTYSTLQRRKRFGNTDEIERAKKFQAQFCSSPGYGIGASMFVSEKGRESKLDRMCTKVNSLFNKKENRAKENHTLAKVLVNKEVTLTKF